MCRLASHCANDRLLNDFRYVCASACFFVVMRGLTECQQQQQTRTHTFTNHVRKWILFYAQQSNELPASEFNMHDRCRRLRHRRRRTASRQTRFAFFPCVFFLHFLFCSKFTRSGAMANETFWERERKKKTRICSSVVRIRANNQVKWLMRLAYAIMHAHAAHKILWNPFNSYKCIKKWIH